MTSSSPLTAEHGGSLPRISERAVYVPIAFLMIVLLHFQTLPVNIPIQALPLTTVVALMAFPFVLGKTWKSPLLVAVFLFAGYAFVHSLVALSIDLFSGYPDTRFIAWVRQFVALLAGVITFYVFRVTLVYLSMDQILRYIVLGSIPGLLFPLMNVLWGALGMQWLGSIVTAVRRFMSPEGYLSAFRASGFAVEPAALASIIVILLLPVLLIYLGWKRNLRSTILLLGLSVVVFVWTFSLSGLLLLLVVLSAGMMLGPLRGRIITLVLVFLAFATLTLVLFPSNQVFRHARSLAVGQANLSMNDRLYGVIGPFIRSSDTWTIVGYGLGGVSAHFDEVVPKRVQTEILSSKWKEYPTISSLLGRTFAETGAVGFMLFLVMSGFVFWELEKLIRNTTNETERLPYASIRLGLLAVFASLFVTIGPYHTPYFWFWIAVVDAQYMLLLQRRHDTRQFE